MEKVAADRIKKLRIERGKKKYTQAVVAKWIETDPTNYGRKERGEVVLTADEYLTILKKFGEPSEALDKVEELEKYTELLEKYIALKEECEKHKDKNKELKKQIRALKKPKLKITNPSRRHDDPEDFDPTTLRNQVHELFKG